MEGELLTVGKEKVDNTKERKEEDMGRIGRRDMLIVNQGVVRG